MKRTLLLAAKVLVTTFLILYLVLSKDIDLKRSWQYVQQSDWLLLALAFALLMSGQFLCTIRWRLILLHLGIRIDLSRLVQFYLIGMFFSLFFPTVIGGDVIKVYYVRRDSGKSAAYGLASVYLERATGFFALLTYGIVGAWLQPIQLTADDFRPIGWLGLDRMDIIWIPIGFMACFLLANVIIGIQFVYGFANRLLERLGLGRVAERIITLRDALGAFRDRPRSLAFPVLLSFINIGLVVIMNWLVARALGIRVSMIVFCAVVSLMTILVMLPISINGIGLRENSFVVLLALVGVSPEQSFALSWISFLIIVLSALPGGMCYSLLKREIPIPPGEDILNKT